MLYSFVCESLDRFKSTGLRSGYFIRIGAHLYLSPWEASTASAINDNRTLANYQGRPEVLDMHRAAIAGSDVIALTLSGSITDPFEDGQTYEFSFEGGKGG